MAPSPAMAVPPPYEPPGPPVFSAADTLVIGMPPARPMDGVLVPAANETPVSGGVRPETSSKPVSAPALVAVEAAGKSAPAQPANGRGPAGQAVLPESDTEAQAPATAAVPMPAVSTEWLGVSAFGKTLGAPQVGNALSSLLTLIACRHVEVPAPHQRRVYCTSATDASVSWPRPVTMTMILTITSHPSQARCHAVDVIQTLTLITTLPCEPKTTVERHRMAANANRICERDAVWRDRVRCPFRLLPSSASEPAQGQELQARLKAQAKPRRRQANTYQYLPLPPLHLAGGQSMTQEVMRLPRLLQGDRVCYECA